MYFAVSGCYSLSVYLNDYCYNRWSVGHYAMYICVCLGPSHSPNTQIECVCKLRTWIMFYHQTRITCCLWAPVAKYIRLKRSMFYMQTRCTEIYVRRLAPYLHWRTFYAKYSRWQTIKRRPCYAQQDDDEEYFSFYMCTTSVDHRHGAKVQKNNFERVNWKQMADII